MMETPCTLYENVTKDTVVIAKYEKFDLDMANYLVTTQGLLTMVEKKKIKAMLGKKIRDDQGTRHKVNYFTGVNADRTSRKGNDFFFVGRLISDGGFQSLQKNVRAALAKNYYFDIDMENAHPVMLIQMCEKNGWKCKALAHYVNHRNELFELFKEQGFTRDEVKIQALKMMYGGKPDEQCPAWLANTYYDNMRDIMVKFAEAYPQEYENAKKFKKYNSLGRCMANILQTKERECLLALIKSLEIDGRKVGTLMHDGCYVEKETNEMEIDSDILRRAEDFIFEKTGFRHKITVKPIETTYTVPNKEEVQVGRVYANVKANFEKNHFKCINRSCFVKLCFDEVKYMSKTDLMTSYGHEKYEEEGNKNNVVLKPFLKTWLEDEKMLTYEDLGVYPPPLVAPKGYYNLWDGFRIEKIDEESDNESLHLLLEHIKFISTNDCYDYVLKWMALLFQQPGRKPNVCILIKAIQGLGKNFVYEMLANMIGKKYSYCGVDLKRDVFGDFNHLMEGKILVALDEVNMEISSKYRGKVFELITGVTETVNSKGKNQKTNTGLSHVLVFSNNEWPWKIEEGDRRCLAINNEEKVLSSLYYAELDLLIRDDQTLKALYEYLMSIDVSSFDPKDDRPVTEFSKELKMISMGFEKQFYIDLITTTEEKELIISSKEMYSKFKIFIFDNFGDKVTCPSQMKFSLSVKKFGGCVGKKTTACNVFVIDTIEARKWAMSL